MKNLGYSQNFLVNKKLVERLISKSNILLNNLDYLCKALKNRHFRGYGQPNLLPIYYFCGKSLDMRSTARASRPDGAAHR